MKQIFDWVPNDNIRHFQPRRSAILFSAQIVIRWPFPSWRDANNELLNIHKILMDS